MTGGRAGPPRPRRARAVVFDVDGTLADSEGLSKDSWDHVLARYGVQRSDSDDRCVTGLSFGATRDHFAARAPSLPPEEILWVDYSARLLQLIQAEVQPFPDALALLLSLRRRGIPVALASSSRRERVSATLKALGLDDLEAVSVAGDEVRVSKPAPDVFFAAARLTEVSAHHCVAVEDSGPGVAAAIAAGMQVVAVRREPWAVLDEATLVVDSLRPTTLDPFLRRTHLPRRGRPAG